VHVDERKTDRRVGDAADHDFAACAEDEVGGARWKLKTVLRRMVHFRIAQQEVSEGVVVPTAAAAGDVVGDALASPNMGARRVKPLS
jgi:hypothetical protein